MICSNSKYDEFGDLTYRITAGEKVFPEVLEVEYNDKHLLTSQSLYDLVKNQDGKEFKKLKLRTEVIYNDDGRVSKVSTPESIVWYSYKEHPVDIPFGEEFRSTVAKTTSYTEYLLQDENGADRPDTTCYIVEKPGIFEFKEDILTIQYNSVRILESYKKGTRELLRTEYFVYHDQNLVYYQSNDSNGEVNIKIITEYDNKGRITFTCADDYNNLRSDMTKYEYDVIYSENDNTGKKLDLEVYNTSRRIIDMETEEEIYQEDSRVSSKFVEKDDKTYFIITDTVTQYDIENEDEAEVFNVSETTYDEFFRPIKVVDNNEKKTTYYTYPDDEDDQPSRILVKHHNINKKITPFKKDKLGVPMEEETHLVHYSIFEEKLILLQLVKYANGYIRKDVKITVEGREVAHYITDNGQDATVGIMFDALYSTFDFADKDT